MITQYTITLHFYSFAVSYIGLGWVGLGWVGSGWVGLGWVGSGHAVNGLGRVGTVVTENGAKLIYAPIIFDKDKSLCSMH